MIFGFLMSVKSFNPRSRVGSDAPNPVTDRAIVGFNPRSRVGSDPLIAPMVQRVRGFQSTLPRGERQNHDSEECSDSDVSIHAPAWGATLSSDALPQTLEVSIHAPAWGATTLSPSRGVCTLAFQSTLPRGERLLSTSATVYPSLFQSTLPRGERHSLAPAPRLRQ